MAEHPAAISWTTLAGHVADWAVNGRLRLRKFDSIPSRGNRDSLSSTHMSTEKPTEKNQDKLGPRDNSSEKVT